MAGDRLLDVRVMPHGQRHTTILDTLGALARGEALEIVVDHDPKPLSYQLAAEQPGAFTWEYLEQGPEAWRVRITRTEAA